MLWKIPTLKYSIIEIKNGMVVILGEKKRRIAGEIKPAIVALIIISLLVGLVIGYFIPRPVEEIAGGLSGEIPIGICLTLTGDFASYGARAKVAVEIAFEEIDDFVSKARLPVT
ncbi:MAG: hypothetical protein QXH37_08860, partial [Candidatus Bathyarchaeia archaeon]